MIIGKALIAASAVALFLLPLATPVGLMAGVAGTIAGYLLAARAARSSLRLPAGLVLAGLAIALGHFGSRWILDRAPGGGTAATIQGADPEGRTAPGFARASIGCLAPQPASRK